MAVVSLKKLTKVYNNSAAVEEVSLDLDKGELVCLLGPSGCGKTTTLRMVAGFVQPTSGSVLIEGKDVTNLAPYRRDTGMVFQSYALFPHMTVAQNISFGLENIGVQASARKQRVKEMLELVELSHLSGRYPSQLSGGQQQRVALARALAMNPAVLLLDEPFSNLDAQLRVRLREDLRAMLKRIQITTLFVTHDQEEALMFADRVVVMRSGHVEQIGTPAEIYETPRTRFVAEFIGWCSIFDGVVSHGEFCVGEAIRLPLNEKPGPATVIVRPEHVKPAKNASDAQTLQAEVLSSNYYGALCRLRLNVSGQEVLMEAHYPHGNRPASGDRIAITIDPSGARCLPA
ncbi:ABC transporter ATP-binding protein [Bradyrhizobium sp. USDA 4486]